MLNSPNDSNIELKFMKKIFFYLILASIGVISVYSCKTKEHCPAYGKKTEIVKPVHI